MLVSREDFDKFNLGLPKNFNPNKLNKAIREAEDNDLSNFFNPEFLYDLKTNSTQAIYKDLLDGKVYKKGTYDMQFAGLKAAIVYFAYSRLIITLNQTVTDNAFVQKESEYSTPVSSKLIAMETAEAESMAKFYMQQVDEFMCYNSASYIRYSRKNKKLKYKVYNNGNR